MLSKSHIYTLGILFLGVNGCQAVKPEDVLKDNEQGKVFTMHDGSQSFVRKGTIAATIQNVKALNNLLQAPFSAEGQQKYNDTVADIGRAIPALKVLELFDVFP